MAQANYTPIQLYRSTTASAVPTSGNLAAGELAINTNDGKLYYKDSGGTVQLIASKAGASGDVVGPASATDNAVVRFDGTTGKLVQNSVVTIADSTGDVAGVGALTASGNLTLSGGTANGVLYLNGSKVATSGSAVTYNGTTFATSADASISGLTVGKGAGAVSTNTAVGASALATSNTGPRQTAIGYRALSAYSGSVGYNVAIGSDALQNTTGSYDNVAVGDTALNGVSSGVRNVGVGNNAIAFSQSGSDNTAVGTSALRGASLNSFSNNTAVGSGALYSNTTASNNTAVGYQAGYSSTGVDNCFIGYQAGLTNTTGTQNVYVGRSAGAIVSSSTGSNNSVLGFGALVNLTSGSNNIAIGTSALQANNTASNNTAVGYQAGYSNQTGTQNTFLGNYAGYSSTSNYNTFLGMNAGYYTTGSANTFVGNKSDGNGAGQSITTGSKNTILGGYNGNQGGLDIRTANNYIVLSDGDGNPILSTCYGRSLAISETCQPQPGFGITFPATQNPSSNANTLDDYEEGAWGMTVTPGGGTITSYTATGTYTKIGRQVTVNGLVTITTVGTANGAMIVTLPFTSGSNSAVIGRENTNTGYIVQGRIGNTGTDMTCWDGRSANGDIFVAGNNMSVLLSATYFV